MIKITNNTVDFLEKETGELFIYGAGNAGYWIGYYMNRCGLDFYAYFDKKKYREEAIYNGKPIFQPEKLKEYKEKSIRIIVSPMCYESVLADLLWMEHLYGFHALCLVPRYKHISTKEEGYHINKLLAYFRRRLFVGEIPTILSNNCTAGFIYDLMDMIMLSPTINTGICPTDFLKLCNDYKRYLNDEMVCDGFEKCYGNFRTVHENIPVGRIGDIHVQFGHSEENEDVYSRWNMMRLRINWNRIICVAYVEDNYLPFSIKNERDFMELPTEHLMIVSGKTPFYGGGLGSKLYMQENYFAKTDSAIENYFDLLGWMNQEYKES